MFELSKHEVEHLHLLDQGLRLHEARLQLVLQGPELQEALIVLFCFMAHEQSNGGQYILAGGSFVKRLAACLRTITFHLISNCCFL